MVKIENGKYILGCELRKIMIKGKGPLIRTGGGYIYLEEFLRYHARQECLKLKVNMVKKKKTYKETVSDFITRHTKDKKVLKSFIDNCPDDIDEQFNEVVDAVKSIHEQKTKRKSIKNRSPLKKMDSEDMMKTMTMGKKSINQSLLVPTGLRKHQSVQELGLG